MADIENAITHLQIIKTWASFAREHDLQFFTPKHLDDIAKWSDDALALLKEQETELEHLWDAPDRTFKGRCKKCGFVHFFIEGHDTQYKFCPECGRSVKRE